MSDRTIVFDLDGTVLNTLEDLADAVNYALAQNGYPLRTVDEVRRFIGNGIRTLIERAVPANTSKECTDRVYDVFLRQYREHCADKTRPYEGIIELLHRLRAEGYQLAVVSNKADAAVCRLCQNYFDGLFDRVVGEREGIRRKPAPDSVLAVLSELGASPDRAVYIGDSDVDIETARNAGMPCIGVAWGFRGEALLLERGASVVVRDTEALYQAIVEHLANSRAD